jgi:hypothetical protein
VKGCDDGGKNSPAAEERTMVPTQHAVTIRPERDRVRFTVLKIRRAMGLKPSNS